MFKLYIANKNYSSWSLRPWILLKELNIEFEEILVPFSESNSSKEFKIFSPNGRVPCLYDNDMAIWDSLSICEYIAESYTEAWPGNKVARAWARSAVAEMHSGLNSIRSVCGMNVGLSIKLFEISDGLQQDLNRIEELFLDGLNKFGGPFLAGKKFTIVDAFFAPVIFRYRTYGLPMSDTIKKYSDLILSLKGIIQWEKDALLEPWRDASHENEVSSFGNVLYDFRKSNQ